MYNGCREKKYQIKCKLIQKIWRVYLAWFDFHGGKTVMCMIITEGQDIKNDE